MNEDEIFNTVTAQKKEMGFCVLLSEIKHIFKETKRERKSDYTCNK